MRNLAVAVLMLLMSVIIIACGDEGSGKGGDQNVPVPSPAPVQTIGDEMIALISVHCVECHNSEVTDGDLDLSQVSDILANAQAIVDSIKDGSMPEGKKLSSEELSLVDAWQAEGFPAPSAGTKVGTDPNAGPNKDEAGQNDASQNDASQNDSEGKEKDKKKNK